MASSTTAPVSDGLVASIQAAHHEIKALLDKVVAGTDVTQNFERLATLAAAHEAAEQEIVHPLTARADGGETVAEERLHEEHEGAEALQALQRMGVTDPGFDDAFSKLRAAVLIHATNEERDEHPILESSLSPEESQQAAKQFRAAQSVSA